MNRLHVSALCALALALCLNSCGNFAAAPSDRPWLESPRMQEWQVLKSKKAALASAGLVPQMQEFVGAGTMFVWKHSLDGGPGWEYLRASYTYENTTEEAFDWVRVWCEILDPDGRIVNRAESVLMHPLGYEMDTNDTWSDTIKVATRGAHLRSGWRWRIGCEPVFMKVLPPARATTRSR